MNYLIVPAWSDQASQCRIVSRAGAKIDNPLASYRASPNLWADAGIMNSRGKLVCLSAPREHQLEFRDCEPLMAGTTFYMED